MKLPFVIIIFSHFLLLFNICHSVQFYFPYNLFTFTGILNQPPIGEHLKNVRKLSNFLGARNLRFGGNNTLYFDSNHIFNGQLGCHQIYSLDLEGSDNILNVHDDLLPHRISYCHASVEHPQIWLNAGMDENSIKSNSSSILLFSSNAAHFDSLNHSAAAAPEFHNQSRTTTMDYDCKRTSLTVGEKFVKYLSDRCSNQRWHEPENPICKKWFEKDLWYRKELIGWLNPGINIFLSDFDDNGILATSANAEDDIVVSILHPLVEGPNFDGFPAISKMHNGHVLYFISVGQGQQVPQLWQTDMPKGNNKKQLTDTDAWKLGPINVSPAGHKLIFPCIPHGNGINEKIFNATFPRQSFPGIYNVSAQKLCTFDLGDDGEGNELKILDFGGTQTEGYRLYQLSSPAFISDENILFSARMMDTSGMLTYSEFTGQATVVETDISKNTALFMSNFDGTKLERITDYRPKNNHVAFDASTGHLAWTTTDSMIAGNDFVNYIYIAHLNIPKKNWGSDGTKRGDARYEIVNAVQLTKLDKNQFAMHPKFSPNMDSIIYELISIRPTNSTRRMVAHSEIRRLSIASVLNQFKNDNFACGKCGEDAITTKSAIRGGKEWRISSPFETASRVANFDPDGNFLAYSAMPKVGSNNRHAMAKGNCNTELEKEFGRKPMLEQLLNYRKFYDGMDIYKYNAIGQMIHPIVKGEGFDGDLTMHVVNETFCQMVFTSANLKSGKKNEDVKFNLWHVDYCSMHNYWISMGGIQTNAKLHESLRKMSNDTEAKYQGEATFSPNGAEVAFVQAMSVESNTSNTIIRGCDNSYILHLNHTEIFTTDSNGTTVRQLTVLNSTSLTPKFLPNRNGNDGLIIFSSNYGGEQQQTRRPFSLFIANQQQDGKLNGNNVKKVQISAGNIAGMNGENNQVFPDVKAIKPKEFLVVWSSGKSLTLNLFIGKLVIH